MPWADGVSRMTRFFVGGFLGDQQEGDKYTGEPCACHLCQAPRDSYLSTDYFPYKTMKFTRNKVQLAAEGAFLKINNQKAKWIVRWDSDGRNVRAGPGIGIISIISIISIITIILTICICLQTLQGAKHYESQRKKAGCHLLFNAFWLIPHFCINLMYMRDTMHQIDLGVIISFMKAILRKYLECAENHLNIPGRAVKKITEGCKEC